MRSVRSTGPTGPMTDQELQDRRRLAELAAFMFDRSYDAYKNSRWVATDDRSEERWREGTTPVSKYTTHFGTRGKGNGRRMFYEDGFDHLDMPDFAKKAFRNPRNSVINDLANRIIYMGSNTLFTTEGQDEAYKELVELADLVRKYPDAVTGVAKGLEGTVDFIDASNPPSERLATMMTKKGLPTYTPDNRMKPLRKNDADRVVEEQPIMSDPAESARRAGFRGVESEPKQIGVKRFFRRPDGTGYVKTEMFNHGGRFSGPTGPAELTFPQEMLIRGMFMESSFKPKAKSGDNAQGIAQFTPIAIKDMKQMGFVDDDFDPYDVNQARDAQEKFMNYFITRNEGTDEVRLAKAAAAYNYGQTNLNRYLAKQVAKGVDTMNTLDWVDGLNDETKDYVRAVVLNDLGDRADEYEKRRPIYFDTYPDVQDERQATPREDSSPQISPELQKALDIMVRDQKNYEHGGKHDEDKEPKRKVKDITDQKYRVISDNELDAYERYGEEMNVLNDLVNYYRATHPIGNFIFEQARKAMAPYIMENVRPIEYPTISEMGKALQHMIDGTRAAPQRDPDGNYVAAEEAFARSLGLNPEERYFTRSDYRPSTSQDPDAQYYRYEEMSPYAILKEAIRQGLLDGVPYESETVLDDGTIMYGYGTKGPYKTSVILPGSDRVNELPPERRGIDPLQRFKVSIGQDEKGPYLSYYDKYDLHGIANQILAEPMEIYDRFYLDDPRFGNLANNYRSLIMRALSEPNSQASMPSSEGKYD